VDQLPRGTVSLLFTDIEGSTLLQHSLQERYREVVNEHRRLLEEAIESNGGLVVDRQTESFFAVFPRMRDAAVAACAAQTSIAAHEWPDGAQVKVRMGIHAGEPELDGDRYVGLAVARAARIAATAHGGQVIMSGTARGLLDGRYSARSLGSYPLKDFDAPEPLYQLQADGLAERFPRPRVTPRRSQRTLILIGAAVIGLLIAAAVAAVVVSRSGAGAASLVEANNVGVIDPATNKVVDQVPVGKRPGPVAFGAGSVWVGNIDDRTLTQLDASTRTNAGLVPLDNQTPTGIAYREREGLWVAHGVLGGLSKVDPQFGQVTDTIEIGGRSSEGTGEVAVGAGSAWAVFGESTIARVDPAGPRLENVASAGFSPTAVAVANDLLWIANSSDQSVEVFALGTFDQGPIRSSVPVGRGPSALAFSHGAMWVANTGDDTVTRIDSGSFQRDTIEVGESPNALAASSEAIWVANGGGTVSRIDPLERKVTETIDVGNAPAGIAVGSGNVWVSVQSP
jgi:YVTN family beta-propeller protein